MAHENNGESYNANESTMLVSLTSVELKKNYGDVMTKSEAQHLLDELRHRYADSPTELLKQQISRLIYQIDNGVFNATDDN